MVKMNTASSTSSRHGVRRLGRRPIVAGALGAVALAAPVAWYLGSPLFIDATVDEAFPSGSTANALSEPAGATPLSRGEFGVVDAIHRGEGSASVFRLSNGQHIMRFDAFRVTNGPDLFVYLSGHPAPRTRDQLHDGADLELGRLKGNVGNQNYDLPAGVDVSRFKSVVVYCKQFSVVFSTAELRPVL
jgi:hypothetical protein